MWQLESCIIFVPKFCPLLLVLCTRIYDLHILILASGTGTGLDSSSGNSFSGVLKKASNKVQIKDGISMEGMLSVFYYNFQLFPCKLLCLMAILVLDEIIGYLSLTGNKILIFIWVIWMLETFSSFWPKGDAYLHERKVEYASTSWVCVEGQILSTLVFS